MMANVKLNVGTDNELARRAVVIQSVTVLEQFLRLVLELDMDEKGGAGRRVVVESVKGLDGAASLGASRVEASGHTFQSAAAVERLAEERGMHVLAGFAKANRWRLELLFSTRHDLVHAAFMIYFDEGQEYATLENAVDAASATRPRLKVARLLVEGQVMLSAGRHAEARSAYERVLDVCDGLGFPEAGEAWAHTSRGHAFARLGRAGEAMGCYRAAAEIDPRYALAHLEMGHLLMRAGRHAEALAMYKRSIKADPDYTPAHVARGHALGVVPGSGGWARAAGGYEDALRVDSEETSACTGCGLALAAEGRHGDAAVWYRRAIKKDPGDAAARTGLANSLAAAGRRGDAIKEYRTAVKIADRTGRRGAPGGGARDAGDLGIADGRIAHDLERGAAYSGLARLLLATGRPEEALPAYRRAAKLDGRSARAHLGVGNTLLKLSRPEEALPAYRRAAELDSMSARAHLGVGNALLATGRPEEALPAYRRAAELDSMSARAHLGVGNALLATGRPEEALPAYRRAAELDGASAAAWAGQAKALAAAGRDREAAKARDAAAEMQARRERRRTEGEAGG